MKYYSQGKQLSLDLYRSSLDELDKSNRWVKLGDLMPWGELEKAYNSKLDNKSKGAGNKPARMVIGALIVKHKLNLSDEETIEMIKENPYMQYLCGLSEFTDTPLFDPSLFVEIRKRIDINDINAMTTSLKAQEERLKSNDVQQVGSPKDDTPPTAQVESADEGNDGAEFVDSEGRKHKGILKIDATCANAEVRYPVDVDIIHDGCKVVDRYINRISDALGLKAKTCYKDARRFYTELVKRKKKGGRLVRLTKRALLDYLQKDLRRLSEIFAAHRGSKALLFPYEQRILRATFDMYHQQLTMLEDNLRTVADRIVSIFQPHIRPIVRGKAKAKVEFGAKIGASIVDGYTFIDHHSWDAYNESSDLKLQVELYKERFGYLPATIHADKIYMSKANRKIIKELGIKNYSKPLGRPPKTVDPELSKKQVLSIGERNEIECTFGTGKRIYRADNIRAKLPETANCWTAMCYFVKNVMKFLRELCRAFFEILTFLAFGKDMAIMGTVSVHPACTTRKLIQ